MSRQRIRRERAEEIQAIWNGAVKADPYVMLDEIAAKIPRSHGGVGIAPCSLQVFALRAREQHGLEFWPLSKTPRSILSRAVTVEAVSVLDGIDAMVERASNRALDKQPGEIVLGEIPEGPYRHATVYIGDTHSTDADFMRDSLWSCLDRVARQLAKFRPEVLTIAMLGDMVTGNDIFRGQEIQNIVSKSHWQAAVGALLVKEIRARVQPTGVQAVRVFYVQGNHDKDRKGNYGLGVVHLAQSVYGEPISYAGDERTHNAGDGETPYHVLCVHGASNSRFRPQAPSFQDNLARRVADLNATRPLRDRIHRVEHGHTHWLDTAFQHSMSLAFDCVGGWQRNSRAALGLTQRPAGVVLHLFEDAQLTVIGVRPEPTVYEEELSRQTLEFDNLMRMGEMLKEAYLAEHPGLDAGAAAE